MSNWPALLSPHFNLSEFQCPCCQQTKVNPKLVIALEWLRKVVSGHVSDPAITISKGGGYRCEKYNASLKGASPQSQHLFGSGADIRVAGMTPQYLADCAETVPYFENGGIGIYDVHIHVDVRDTGRARWDNRS